MSVETILSRMISDSVFAEAVFADAEKALAEYKLSAEEVTKFKGLSRAHFTTMTPDERKSFGIIVPDRGGGNAPDGAQGGNHNETALTL